VPTESPESARGEALFADTGSARVAAAGVGSRSTPSPVPAGMLECHSRLGTEARCVQCLDAHGPSPYVR
jgi:hypothetical protein